MVKHGESLAISVDISKAYDMMASFVSCQVSKLTFYHLDCNWAAGFLEQRQIGVLYDGRAYTSLQVSAGVHQGSMLSPTLFFAARQ